MHNHFSTIPMLVQKLNIVCVLLNENYLLGDAIPLLSRQNVFKLALEMMSGTFILFYFYFLPFCLFHLSL